jgi:hypothetical protein
VNAVDRFVARVQLWQQRHALLLAKICLCAFVLNCFLFGFTKVVIPSASNIFALNAVTLLIGAVANFILALVPRRSDRTK